MSEQSTVHPDGWIGNPAELERARRYRAALRWGMGPFWFLLIAYWVVFLTADDFVLESLIILAAGLLVVLGFYLRRKISEIIGRKWTFRLRTEGTNTAGRPVAAT